MTFADFLHAHFDAIGWFAAATLFVWWSRS